MYMNSITNLKKILLYAAVIVTSMGLHSCLDDDDNNNISLLYPNAIVTTKTTTDNTFFLQLDDSTTLLPVNMDKSPFGDKEVRARVNLDFVNEPSGEFDKAVHVNWIDSILTKAIAPDLGEENDEVYGTDPVRTGENWVVIEDGYLTLRFETLWGHHGKPHYVNLLLGNNPDNPYEVEFRHNAYGDIHGRWANGLVAFRLDALPDTEGKTVKLTLKWNSFEGERTAEFDYCTRKSTGGGEEITSARNQLSIQ